MQGKKGQKLMSNYGRKIVRPASLEGCEARIGTVSEQSHIDRVWNDNVQI